MGNDFSHSVRLKPTFVSEDPPSQRPVKAVTKITEKQHVQCPGFILGEGSRLCSVVWGDTYLSVPDERDIGLLENNNWVTTPEISAFCHVNVQPLDVEVTL